MAHNGAVLTVSLEILSSTGRGDPLLDLPLSLSQFTEMDKCDNISSLSFSNFPLKTSFAIKSFQKSLETHLRIITPLTSSIGTIIHGDRLEICRDRRDRRSCKIFVSCVNFSRKQRSFLRILQVYTHLNVNFLHNC